jgi:hypothetical protein
MAHGPAPAAAILQLAPLLIAASRVKPYWNTQRVIGTVVGIVAGFYFFFTTEGWLKGLSGAWTACLVLNTVYHVVRPQNLEAERREAVEQARQRAGLSLDQVHALAAAALRQPAEAVRLPPTPGPTLDQYMDQQRELYQQAILEILTTYAKTPSESLLGLIDNVWDVAEVATQSRVALLLQLERRRQGDQTLIPTIPPAVTPDRMAALDKLYRQVVTNDTEAAQIRAKAIRRELPLEGFDGQQVDALLRQADAFVYAWQKTMPYKAFFENPGIYKNLLDSIAAQFKAAHPDWASDAALANIIAPAQR